MKTFKIIVVTVMVTMAIAVGGIMTFLFSTGIVTVSEVAQEHTRVVIEDGVVTENSTTKETVGFNTVVAANKLYYIGK